MTENFRPQIVQGWRFLQALAPNIFGLRVEVFFFGLNGLGCGRDGGCLNGVAWCWRGQWLFPGLVPLFDARDDHAADDEDCYHCCVGYNGAFRALGVSPSGC